MYECKDNPREVIDLVRWMNPEALEIATKKIILPHPNTYTYSKRLAESLVASENGNIPVVIVRPSVGKYHHQKHLTTVNRQIY